MRSPHSLLQAKQAQFPQPFLIGEVLQPSDHLSGPPLELLQELHVLPVLGAPGIDTWTASSQQIPNPLNSPSIKSTLQQFREKDVVTDHVKDLVEVQVDDIHCPSPIHRIRHFIIEGHQIGQAQSALGEAMLAVSNHLFVLYMP